MFENEFQTAGLSVQSMDGILNLILTVVNPREDVGCSCDGLKAQGERESPQQGSRKDAASRERSHNTTGLQSNDFQM
jgi:hypothetical protein